MATLEITEVVREIICPYCGYGNLIHYYKRDVMPWHKDILVICNDCSFPIVGPLVEDE